MITAANPLSRGRGLEKQEEAREEIACFHPPSDRHEGDSGKREKVRFNPGIYRMGISPSEGSTALGQNFFKSLTKWNQYFPALWGCRDGSDYYVCRGREIWN